MLFHLLSVPYLGKKAAKFVTPKKERSTGPFKRLLFTGLMLGALFIPSKSLSHPTDMQRFLISDAEKKATIASFEKGMNYSLCIIGGMVIGASVLWGVGQITQKNKPSRKR